MITSLSGPGRVLPVVFFVNVSDLCFVLNVGKFRVGHPHTDKKIQGDPYKTIFVGRLNYDTTQERLYKEFNIFGSVEGVHIVKDTKSSKSRGYAFVEFRDERGAEDAVRRADGRKIDGYKIIVDREFGRTKKGWYPRRLGGGKGEARKNRADEYEIRKLQREIDDEEELKIKNQQSSAMKNDTLDTPLKIETKPSMEEGQLDAEENPSDEKWRDRKRQNGRRGGRSRSRSHSRSRSPPRDRRNDRRDDRRVDRRDDRRDTRPAPQSHRRDERPYDRRDPRDNDRRPRDSDYDRRKRDENAKSQTKKTGLDMEPGEI